MALNTYDDLKTSIRNHLHRGGLDAVLPDFITMGEKRINREMRLLQMEHTAPLTASTSSRYVALPTGFLESINLTLYVSGQPTVLKSISADVMDAQISDVVGQPDYYRITSQIEFECVADSAYPMTMRYIKGFDIAAENTNWLLTTHPDIYLYSSLLAAAPYVKNAAYIEVWRGYFEHAMESANNMDSRTRSDALMTIDAGVSSSLSYDIRTG
jgi:hypothetical protein